MTGHMDESVLNDDSECPGRGSRTPAVRARSSSSQPAAVGSAAGRPGWTVTRSDNSIGSESKQSRFGGSRFRDVGTVTLSKHLLPQGAKRPCLRQNRHRFAGRTREK